MNLQLKIIALFFLMLFIIPIISHSFLLPARAAEITNQEKAISIMDNVIGLDLSKYTVSPLDSLLNSYLGAIDQETYLYSLRSNGSVAADIRFTFANGNLRMIHVLESKDSSILKNSTANTVEMAKEFLGSYHSYSQNSFYDQLNSMLSHDALAKNYTATNGNIKFESINSDYHKTETYRWTYMINGIDAPSKCVALCYENGFLKYFIDNWNLYTIGSTSVNISEKQAIDIAIQRAQEFSWKMGSDKVTLYLQNFAVANAMVWETVFLSNLNADNPRSEDPLALYPIRHVWVALDKFYPGNVYGINVYLWADTGDVAYIHERVSSSDPSSNMIASDDSYNVRVVNNEPITNVSYTLWLAFPVLAVTCGAFTVFLLNKGKVHSKNHPKLFGSLFCLLIISSPLLFFVPTVSASSSQDRVEIWGSECSGAYNSSLGLSWRKTNEEIYYQDMLGDLISIYSGGNGYDAINSQGDDNGNTSFKSSILDSISYNDANYPRIAVVDFDHGNGNTGISGIPSWEFHYNFEDQTGNRLGGTSPGIDANDNGVYDMEIYPRVASGKVCFAFINTCNSAHYGDSYYGLYTSSQGLISGTERARGMPFAWSHRIVYPGNYGDFDVTKHISNNGYDSWIKDNGNFVFLGFVGGSASLNQTVQGSGTQYWQWVRDFFWYAFSFDQSVNDALDDASLDHYNSDFGQTDLANGFEAIWPMWNHTSDQWYNSKGDGQLVEYGNGGIHLYRNGGLWNFDEGTGQTAHDSFVHANDCTIAGPTWTSGKANSALSFDGNDDIVYRYYSSTLNGLSAVTLMQWVKLDSVPQSYSVNLGGILCEYWLEYRSNQYLSLSTYINSQYNGDGFYANLADGRWHLLTMTYDGVHKKGYLDSTLMADYYLPGTLDSTYYQFKVGENFPPSQGYNGCPDGIIDMVRVFDYAFSAEQIADEATVVSYHLNGGDSAYDSSPFSNTGTIYNANLDSGVRGAALSFDGNDFISVPSSSDLDALGQVGTSYSIALWFKTSVKVDQSLTEKWIGQNYPFVLRGPIQNGEVYFALYDGTNNPAVSSGSDLADNTWHYVVATVTRGEKLRLFVDGSLVSETDDTTVGDISNSGAFPIGARSSWPSYPFHGTIDEFRIYDRALSDDDISSYYYSNLPYHWIMTNTIDDSYSNGIDTTFYINDQVVGGAYSYCRVTRGESYIAVDQYLYHPYYGWYEFVYFTVNGGNPDYNNPMTTPITKDTTIEAHYTWYDYP